MKQQYDDIENKIFNMKIIQPYLNILHKNFYSRISLIALFVVMVPQYLLTSSDVKHVIWNRNNGFFLFPISPISL